MILDARSLLNLLLNFGIDAPGIYRPPNLKIFKFLEIFSFKNSSYFKLMKKETTSISNNIAEIFEDQL